MARMTPDQLEELLDAGTPTQEILAAMEDTFKIAAEYGAEEEWESSDWEYSSC